MSDHSWVHLQIVLNSALRLFRLLHRAGVQSSVEIDYAMDATDAEVVIAGALPAARPRHVDPPRRPRGRTASSSPPTCLDDLLADVYEEPERTIVASEIMHAIIGHRKGGAPADARGGRSCASPTRSTWSTAARASSFETRLPNIHSLSAAAIDEVRIVPGEQRTIRVEVDMNNSAGVFQVDELLASKLRGSGLEDHIEVVARIEAEHEKRLLTVYRI